jgi:hypothetical protein
VNTGSDPTASAPQYCASGTDKFSDDGDPDVSVFEDIGASLSKLRVARQGIPSHANEKSPADSAGLSHSRTSKKR